jgi:hypothetical protein
MDFWKETQSEMMSENLMVVLLGHEFWICKLRIFHLLDYGSLSLVLLRLVYLLDYHHQDLQLAYDLKIRLVLDCGCEVYQLVRSLVHWKALCLAKIKDVMWDLQSGLMIQLEYELGIYR